MKITLTAALLVSFVSIAAQADDNAQQNKQSAATTTGEWLAQPSKDAIANVEPAAGGESTGTGNPLLDNKLQNFKH